MNKCTERIYNGIIKENPTFVMMLGMCPTMAVTTAAINGIGMGLATTAVLVASNMLISMLRKVIPDKVRMPAYIVIVASFVTVVEMLLEAYFYESLYKSLGIYIPLIVVNCIILGRAESYASKNDVLSSVFDGVGMGLGFTAGLLVIGAVRELIGSGQLFGFKVLPGSYEPISIFVLAPGAFFVIAFLTALQNKFNAPSASNKKDTSEDICSTGCAGCHAPGCSSNIEIVNGIDEGGR